MKEHQPVFALPSRLLMSAFVKLFTKQIIWMQNEYGSYIKELLHQVSNCNSCNKHKDASRKSCSQIICMCVFILHECLRIKIIMHVAWVYPSPSKLQAPQCWKKMQKSPLWHTPLTYNKLDKLYLGITYRLYHFGTRNTCRTQSDSLLLCRESRWGIWACLPLVRNGDWFGGLNELLASVFIAFIKI